MSYIRNRPVIQAGKIFTLVIIYQQKLGSAETGIYCPGEFLIIGQAADVKNTLFLQVVFYCSGNFIVQV